MYFVATHSTVRLAHCIYGPFSLVQEAQNFIEMIAVAEGEMKEHFVVRAFTEANNFYVQKKSTKEVKGPLDLVSANTLVQSGQYIYITVFPLGG